jgi:hypothetical protein
VPSDVKKMDIIYLLYYRGDKINEFYEFIVNRFNGVTKVFILFNFFFNVFDSICLKNLGLNNSKIFRKYL